MSGCVTDGHRVSHVSVDVAGDDDRVLQIVMPNILLRCGPRGVHIEHKDRH